ncbi:hypothetical protein M1O29_03895 [Dehalococcoidia bacterium]|nr:hypothetical protein [Dehalococcoidia bacterium]
MKSKIAFFSFTGITDPKRHRDYNIWHQLDHRPENLALEGVPYGERWVSSPDCITARSVSDPMIHDFHYMNMYWMIEPVERTVRDFIDLGASTMAIGRRPEVPYTKRYFTGFFLALKGYSNPRVLISPEALPYRPTRGVFATMHDLPEPESEDAIEMLQWYDEIHIPDVLECKGVAGAWTFTADARFASTAGANPNKPGRRIHLYYLDEDPLEFLKDLNAHVPQWKAAGRLRDNSKTKKDLFVGPLRTILPWEWNWFD